METGTFYATAGDCYFFPPSGDIWTGLNNIDFGKAGSSIKNAWVPFLPDQFKSELIATAKVVIVDSLVLAAFFKLQLVRFAEFSWSNYWIGLAALYIWFELWFYWTHRFMHHPKLS